MLNLNFKKDFSSPQGSSNSSLLPAVHVLIGPKSLSSLERLERGISWSDWEDFTAELTTSRWADSICVLEDFQEITFDSQ